MFAEDLFAAYLKYAKICNLQYEALSACNGHLVARIVGPGVWKAFNRESGKHCVQRIPPTEKGGRRQTSYLAVAVLPVPKQDRCALVESDIDIKTQRGHGKGGQHQNKTDSAVRMRHKPTGLHVFINGRSQHANRREALKILSAKVADYQRAQADVEYGKLRKQRMGDGGRGNKIRTYNFIKSRAVDHRSGKKTGQVWKIIERGAFNLLM